MWWCVTSHVPICNTASRKGCAIRFEEVNLNICFVEGSGLDAVCLILRCEQVHFEAASVIRCAAEHTAGIERHGDLPLVGHGGAANSQPGRVGWLLCCASVAAIPDKRTSLRASQTPLLLGGLHFYRAHFELED